MLMIMTSEAYRNCILTQTIPKKKVMLYNYNSLYKCDSIGMNEIFPYGDKAILHNISLTNQRDFDMSYANFIMSEVPAFNAMLMMMYHLYIGNDVIILIGTDLSEPAQMVLDSYLKFIQQRYGTIANYVYGIEDYDSLDESQQIFSYQGLFNWDQDKKKAELLIVNAASEYPEFGKRLKHDMLRSETKM